MAVSNDNLVKEIARTQDRYITLLKDTGTLLDKWWDKAAGENDMAHNILTDLEYIIEMSKNDKDAMH